METPPIINLINEYVDIFLPVFWVTGFIAISIAIAKWVTNTLLKRIKETEVMESIVNDHLRSHYGIEVNRISKRKNEELLEEEDYLEKPKNDFRLRLTEDGEFTEDLPL